MGLITLLLIVVVILAVIGLGWKTFSVGIISGFETILDVGPPIVKDFTQQAKEYVNNAQLIVSSLVA